MSKKNTKSSGHEAVKVTISGSGVATVDSKLVIRSDLGRAQLKALKLLKVENSHAA